MVLHRDDWITVDDDRPVSEASVRIVRVSECLGRRWAVSPRRRTVYYLSTLSPSEMADAIMEGVAALAEHDNRPRLQLVHSTRLAGSIGPAHALG